MRDLASVVTISTKNKMFEKDRICVVTFEELGYEAIVPVNHNVGDKMVFIQEGAILPVEERWEFLRKRCYREDLQGFLIKPMTMGAKDNNGQKGDKVKSWGLCVTLTEAGLPENLKAGTDVTDKLNIRKYEPEEDASPKKMTKVPRIIKFFLEHKLTRWIGNMYMDARRRKYTKGSFPTNIISKSDETTIQNCKSIMSMFPGTKAFITAKMEGQSFTCSLDPKKKYKFYVCSRNNRLVEGESTGKVFYDTAKRYDIANKLKAYYKKTGQLLMIQGEQVGPSIQENIYDLKQVEWFVFRMKKFVNKQWIEMPYFEFRDVAIDLGLNTVPLVEVVEDMGSFDTIDKLVSYAEKLVWTPQTILSGCLYHPTDKEKLWKDYLQHEGMVVKSFDYDKEKGRGFSFKVKNLAYAEKGLKEIAKACRDLENKK